MAMNASAAPQGFIMGEVDASLPEGMIPPQMWNYALRRRAQEIVPGLFLGPYTVARRAEVLHALGITHIAIFRSRFEATAQLHPQLPGFEYLILEVEESLSQNVITKFPAFRDFMEQAQHARAQSLADLDANPHLRPAATPELLATMQAWSMHSAPVTRGNVLACCLDGVSRAPTFAIAYIMETFKLSFSNAVGYVQSRRFCIFPADGFRAQLLEYEPILLARQQTVPGAMRAMQLKRQIEHVSQDAMDANAEPAIARPAKRRAERDEDSDEDMQG
ncbi:hypothetical protein H9P43_001241 [Blastocladiella emersonii ATCC 22665]|nr:hypothetical protein H9P43_001241 [Blastocladiella emersonii ATCC 22665]